MNPILWQPTQQQIDAAQITAFMQRVNQDQNQNLTSYDALYDWSIEHPENFWTSVSQFCDLVVT